MGDILYEVTYQFHFQHLFQFFPFIFIYILLKTKIEEELNQNNNKNHKKFIKIFILVYCIIVGIFCISTIMGEIKGYNKIIGAYRNGNYNTVEGYVENYSPMPYSGHAMESFTINGVRFEYSDFVLWQGYNNTASHGGVITHNGQHLKLRYIEKALLGENVIVYIEELH